MPTKRILWENGRKGKRKKMQIISITIMQGEKNPRRGIRFHLPFFASCTSRKEIFYDYFAFIFSLLLSSEARGGKYEATEKSFSWAVIWYFVLSSPYFVVLFAPPYCIHLRWCCLCSSTKSQQFAMSSLFTPFVMILALPKSLFILQRIVKKKIWFNKLFMLICDAWDQTTKVN